MKYLVFMLLLGMLGCKVLPAQKKDLPTCINKVYAFSEQHFMGNLPVDEKGNPLRSAAFVIYTFYIESQGADTPTWRLLTAEKDSLNINAVEELPDQNITVGKQKGLEKAFVLQKTKGTHLWKIESGPVEGSIESNKHTSFTLSGTCRGKSFAYPINETIALDTPLAP